MKREDFVNSHDVLVAYLAFKDQDDMSGGRSNHEARAALVNLFNLPEDVFEIMKRGKVPQGMKGP